MKVYGLLALAHAAPINPWGAATPADSAAVAPFVYVYRDRVEASLYVGQGYQGADVYLGVSGSVGADAASLGAIEFFPRFFVYDWLALVPRVWWVPVDDFVTLGGELHVALAKGPVAFTGNAGWRPMVGGDGLAPGTAVVLAAPEAYILEDRLSVFVELDYTYELESRAWNLLVVPGVSTAPFEGRADSFALGAQIPVDGGPLSVAFKGTFVP